MSLTSFQSGTGTLSPAPSGVRAGVSEEVTPCWNQIGVYGDRSCKELNTAIHCRNCPVYSSAGVQLLNRAMTTEYRHERTSHFTQEKKLASAGKVSALVFRVHSEWLSLPAKLFQEVAPVRLIHSLPHRRQGIVLGLVNVRGELIICVSLARILGVEAGDPDYKRLLVFVQDESRIAFPVSEVYGIHRFDPQLIKEAPATLSHSEFAISRGVFLWENRTVGTLDPNSLLNAINRGLT